MKSAINKSLCIAFTTLAAGALAWTASCLAFDHSTTGAKTAVSVAVNDSPLVNDARSGNSYSPIVKKVAPSVVYIFTSKTVKNPMSEMQLPMDNPLFRQFFGDSFDGGTRPQHRQPQSLKQHGLGSGVIVTRDGYILTNNHVVDGADEIKVARVKDSKQFTARVVGRDPKTDVAVLKIDASDLPFVTFADSDKLEVGDVVLAIGNPFGVGQTVTMGIVSATGRGNMGIEDYEDFIQTDAAINPGNSGGALVDTEGRLVGINTAILSHSGGNQGVGFAIPANQARNTMEGLIADGRIVRGFLGISIQDVTPALAKEFNLKKTDGALVGDVTAKSAAADAGIKTGDVITELDGKPVTDGRNLRLRVGRLAPGTKVALKVLREGSEKSFTVTLKEMPEQKLAMGGSHSTPDNGDALNGVTVGDIDAATREQFKLPANLKGAVIMEVEPDSTSYTAGLRQGDVIQEINRKPVANADEAVEASKHIKDKQALVRVWSHGGGRYVVVDEGKAG